MIGGASGMPPVLGWTGGDGPGDARALILFLIIFVLDATALLVAGAVPGTGTTRGRLADAAGDPWPEYTRTMILRYTLALFAVTLLPFAIGMSGWLYWCAVALSGQFPECGAVDGLYSRRAGAPHLPLLDRSSGGSVLAPLIDHYALTPSVRG